MDRLDKLLRKQKVKEIIPKFKKIKHHKKLHWERITIQMFGRNIIKYVAETPAANYTITKKYYQGGKLVMYELAYEIEQGESKSVNKKTLNEAKRECQEYYESKVWNRELDDLE